MRKRREPRPTPRSGRCGRQPSYTLPPRGDVAQLGEHRVRIAGVEGFESPHLHHSTGPLLSSPRCRAQRPRAPRKRRTSPATLPGSPRRFVALRSSRSSRSPRPRPPTYQRASMEAQSVPASLVLGRPDRVAEPGSPPLQEPQLRTARLSCRPQGWEPRLRRWTAGGPDSRRSPLPEPRARWPVTRARDPQERAVRVGHRRGTHRRLGVRAAQPRHAAAHDADIQTTVDQTLASQTPPPADSLLVYAAAQPSLVLIEATHPERAAERRKASAAASSSTTRATSSPPSTSSTRRRRSSSPSPTARSRRASSDARSPTTTSPSCSAIAASPTSSPATLGNPNADPGRRRGVRRRQSARARTAR